MAETPANVTAEQLNGYFTALLNNIDAYYNSFDNNAVRDQVINSVIEWQNEYFGKEIYSIDLERWRKVFDTSLALVEMSIKLDAKPEALPVSKPKNDGRVAKGETIYVKGYVDPMSINKFPIGKDPYFTILAGFCVVIPTTLWLYVRSRKNRRQLRTTTL